MHKNGVFADLLYLTLIVSVLRPNQYDFSDNSNRYSELLSGSAIDGYGPTSVVSIYLDNLRNAYSFDSVAKTNVLYAQSIDILRDVNSLGRYSRLSSTYDNQLYAYLVNGTDNDGNDQQSIISIASTSSSSQSPTTQPIRQRNDSISLDTDSLSQNSSLNVNISGLVDVNDSFINDILKNECDSDMQQEDDGFVENNLLSELEDLDISIENRIPLFSNDPIMPIFDDIEDGTDSLFDELERLLVPEEEELLQSVINSANTEGVPFTDGWQLYQHQLSNSSPVIPNDSQENHNSIYFDATNVNPENRSALDSSNANYELSNSFNSSSLIVPSNIGAALISSMATLTNGSEPIPEIGCSTIYGPEMNDLIYISNATNNISSSSGGEYLLTDLLSEEDLHLIEMSASNANTNNASIPQYHYQSHQYNPNHNQITHSSTNNTAEDCMDASSDSAVSSMSSDRIHSFSDNDWIDSCSETSSHNDEYCRHSSNHAIRSTNTSPQKKYKLFGRRSDNKEDSYSNTNNTDASTILDANNIQNNSSNFGVDYPNCYTNSYAYTDMSLQNHNLYNPSISHNHTYHIQNNDMPSIAAVSAIHQHWSNSKNYAKKNYNRYLNTETEAENDLQLNRDEKKAKQLGIPIPTEDIINLPIDEFNERLAKYELTESQLSLIRDIRRRGKNKVAAQNCRKRKLDQILGLQHEVDGMATQKSSLESQYNQLRMLRDMAQTKYTKLFKFIFGDSNGHQPHYGTATCLPEYHHDLQSDIDEEQHNSFMVSTDSSNNDTRFASPADIPINFNDKFDKQD